MSRALLRWAGLHPAALDINFVRFGPTAAPVDHHLPDPQGAPVEQNRAVLYCGAWRILTPV